MAEIIFIMSKCPHYRIPLYNRLSNQLNIKFIFTLEKGKITALKAPHLIYRSRIGYKKYRINFGLKKILEKEKPKKVVLFQPDPLQTIDNWYLARYLKKKRIPYYLHVGRWEFKKRNIKFLLTDFLNFKLIKNAKKLFAYGTKTKEWLIKRVKVDPKKIVVVYNLNPYIYRNLELKTRTKKSKKLEKKIKILYVGRLIKRKGARYLIEAFSKLKEKNAILTIVGGGDFYQLGARSEEFKLKQLVKELGLGKRVLFTGHLPPNKTRNHYKTAEIFVCSSITEKIGEPWGHVIEEAMSFGLPIITTNAVGAAYDLIKDGRNGIIVQERDTDALKEALERLIENKELRKKMGKESLKILKEEKFKFEKITEKWIRELK